MIGVMTDLRNAFMAHLLSTIRVASIFLRKRIPNVSLSFSYGIAYTAKLNDPKINVQVH